MPKASDQTYPFGYYGGKYTHLGFILPHLPYRTHYIEPFSGSAAVLFARDPSGHEHLNDIDERVWNFFKVARDSIEELVEAIELTPYSEKEFAECAEDEGTPVERARRLYVRINQSVHGHQGNWSRRFATPRGFLVGGWYWKTTDATYDRLRRVSRRLRSVQLHCMDAIDLIKKFSHDDVVLYADPPYVLDTLTGGKPYRFSMNDEQHEELASALHEFPGFAAISGYECDLMNDLYGDWHKVKDVHKVARSTSTTPGEAKSTRQEVLWMNERPTKLLG